MFQAERIPKLFHLKLKAHVSFNERAPFLVRTNCDNDWGKAHGFILKRHRQAGKADVH